MKSSIISIFSLFYIIWWNQSGFTIAKMSFQSNPIQLQLHHNQLPGTAPMREILCFQTHLGLSLGVFWAAILVWAGIFGNINILDWNLKFNNKIQHEFQNTELPLENQERVAEWRWKNYSLIYNFGLILYRQGTETGSHLGLTATKKIT